MYHLSLYTFVVSISSSASHCPIVISKLLQLINEWTDLELTWYLYRRHLRLRMVDPIAPSWTNWPNERLYWDTQRRVLPSGLQSSSTTIERGQHPMTYDASRGRPQNVAGNNEYSGRAPFPASRAQSSTLPSARGPPVQGTQRIATSTFPPPTPSRASEISLPSRREHPWSALSPLWNPINASESPQHQPTSHYVATAPPVNSRPSWVYPLRPGVAYKKTGEERRPVNKVSATDQGYCLRRSLSD